MTADDLPLVRHWLAEPHVVRWWGNPDQQFDLVRGDLDELAMDQFIVVRDARPFAYLQCYDPESWGNCGLGQQPAGTRGIDQLAKLTCSTAATAPLLSALLSTA